MTIHRSKMHLRHSGHSMSPTLREMDLLDIRHFNQRPLRVGDVIVFRHANQARYIVHRVHQSTSTGIRTQGDNAPAPDPWRLRRPDIQGQVVSVWRNGRWRPVAGGNVGRLTGILTQLFNRLLRIATPVLSPLYRRLSANAPFTRLLPENLRPRIVLYPAKTGTRFHLMMGQTLIGRFDAVSGQWRIRRPFRLFFDAGLPPFVEKLESK